MGKYRELIKQAYSEHFDDLKDIADDVDELSDIAENAADPKLKEELKQHIADLEDALKRYAEKLRNRGVELFKNVA